ncbi:hypothetical protein GGX14DRAFT_396222 [Mycena pura]|uniref:Uncharacterized protein n=1 Tax=Mycena pura TaxID=153505 RepID=A0AAD6VB94_9AGAR|nr:hypothetical protein GGX14DRAFT_396222 [Mycena pura]
MSRGPAAVRRRLASAAQFLQHAYDSHEMRRPRRSPLARGARCAVMRQQLQRVQRAVRACGAMHARVVGGGWPVLPEVGGRGRNRRVWARVAGLGAGSGSGHRVLLGTRACGGHVRDKRVAGGGRRKAGSEKQVAAGSEERAGRRAVCEQRAAYMLPGSRPCTVCLQTASAGCAWCAMQAEGRQRAASEVGVRWG